MYKIVWKYVGIFEVLAILCCESKLKVKLYKQCYTFTSKQKQLVFNMHVFIGFHVSIKIFVMIFLYIKI